MGSIIFNALQSPEFWKAIVGFATAGGLSLDPAQANSIVGAGIALMAAINAFKHVTRNNP